MQKKIIALAVAGLVSGVAFAQTNVTVYGVIDQSYTYSKSDNGIKGVFSGTNKFSGLKDGGMSGSRFGFKGEEALGNGLKAIFTMEYGKDSDNNSDVTDFYVRQAFVGLSNNFGTLTLGRQYNAASDVYGQNSSNGAVNAQPVNVFQGVLGSQIRSQGGSARQDNVIKYVSPTFSGFSARADYAFGETGKTNTTANNGNIATLADTTDNGRYSIAGSYANGPFGVDVAYAGQSDVRSNYATNAVTGAYTTLGQGENINEWYIGGRYDFKIVKLFASYQDMDNKTDVVNANTGSKMWQVGLSAPVGAKGTVMVEYAKIDFEDGNYARTATKTAKLDGGNSGWGIGYTHALSKRTTLYTFVSQLDYDKDTASANDWIGGIAAAGEKTSTFSMGVRHAF